MKKLNNNGFAISTLIYGLAIMGIMIVAILMATMAQTRSNNNSLAKSIEEDLNRFSKTETSFKPIGNGISSQEYIVPESGWYKIELWGSQGGGNGGRGSYTGGVIELQEGEVLYFYVGKHKTSGGGYESDVRLVNGNYAEKSSYETRIMAAAGGGSNSTAWGGTLYGYNEKMNSYGGFIKSQGSSKDFSLLPTTETNNNTNGTLVGYNKNYTLNHNATGVGRIGVTVPAPTATNNGGDGFWPSSEAATGGASYIAGYAGCYGIGDENGVKGVTTGNPKFQYFEQTYNETDGQSQYIYSDTPMGEYYFVDGIMMPGVKTGDGYAKIERVRPKTDAATTLIRKNTKLNNVRYIKDCAAAESATDRSSWQKIVAIKDGVSVSYNKTGMDYSEANCRILDLEGNYNLDEIAIFHHPNAGKDYKGTIISVSPNKSVWIPLKGSGSGTQLSETETVTGSRLSAYQYDTIKPLPEKGNYIIQPVLSENKVLTAAKTAEANADPITIDYYNGEKRQLWSIELITDTKISPGYNPNDPSTYEYKIVELARFKALSITQDENIMFNTLSAIDKFNEHARNEPQIWKITPVDNGTYTIETVVDKTKDTGYILPQTNSTVSDAHDQLIIGKKNKDTARFKFIQIDYSSN